MRHNLNRDGGTYRITSTTNVGGTRPQRTNCIALSDTVCYDAEGNVTRVIPMHNPKLNRKSGTTRAKVARRTVEPTRYDPTHDRDILAKMGSIHQ